MIAPAASALPSIIRLKSELACARNPGSWTDPRFHADLYVEAKTTLLLSIRDYWFMYRSKGVYYHKPALRRHIQLKITAYRFFDACRAAAT